MSWKTQLKAEPIDWLLEPKNPSVRYFTLRDILDRPENDSEVTAARKSIVKSKVVERILSKQHPDGYWDKSIQPYHPKYKSSYWQVMILGQLGMDKDDERIQKACDFIFRFQLAEGGFSSYSKKEASLEYHRLSMKSIAKGKPLPDRKVWMQSFITEHQYSCLTGNMVAALIRLGYKEDPRVQKALDWLTSIQNEDGGWLCPYWHAHIKDTHSCFYGTICPLEAFSEIPEAERSNEIKRVIERGAEFLLMHRLFKADHHNFQVIKPQWLKLGFPWFYGYDILRGLVILTKLGYTKDERLNDAVEVLLEKQQPDGKWILESTPAGRMWINIEAKGQPSKWITLNALRVFKNTE
jgi:hypothetical protein